MARGVAAVLEGEAGRGGPDRGRHGDGTGTGTGTARGRDGTGTGRGRDGDGDFASFEAGRPDRPQALAAPVAGTVAHRIGKADCPRGPAGYVFGVAAGPEARRRGTRACMMDELLAWFAFVRAEPLRVRRGPASPGFCREPDPAVILTR